MDHDESQTVVSHSTTGRWKLGLTLSLVASLLWGTLPIALKVLVANVNPKTIVFYRLFTVSLFLSVLLYRKGEWAKLKQPGISVFALFAIATAGLTGNNLVFLLGLEYISPSASQVVIQLAPMFLLTGAVLLLKEPFSRSQWLGLAVLLLGLTLFFSQRLGELETYRNEYTVGVMLVIVSAILWAAFGLSQKLLLSSYSPTLILWVISTAGGFGMLIAAKPLQINQLDGIQLLLLLYCGLNTLLSYSSFGEALVHWETSKVSAVIATTPLITVGLMEVGASLFPSYIEPENLNLPSIAGAALVVLGSILTAVGQRRPPKCYLNK